MYDSRTTLLGTMPMQPEMFIAVAVRMFALNMSLILITTTIGSVMQVEGALEPITVLIIAALFAGYLLLIFVLWKFPLTIARRIYPVTGNDIPKSWTHGDIYIAGFVLLGVYFATQAVSKAAYWRLILLDLRNSDDGISQLGSSQKISIAVVLLQLALSVYLIIGASGIKNVIFRLRYGRIGHNDL